MWSTEAPCWRHSKAMENSRVSANIRNLPCSGKQSLLPPKCPFPSISPSYPDHVSKVPIGSKGIPSPRDGIAYHQRTSSESNLIEEQPSWLDELLNEPESPVRKGHRRSSSDSFAYIDAVTGASNIDYLVHDEYKFKNQVPSWRSHCFDHSKDLQQIHFYRELNSFRNQKSSAWEPTFNSLPYKCGHPAMTDNSVIQRSGFPQEADVVSSTVGEKHDHVESGVAEPKSSSERKDGSLAKVPASEADTKRAKQQFAQRSRVRKLQYIAELERNVQTLQAEGSEFSAELEFLNQQSLILGMENKALKQRLENLAQEQLIKYLEHDVLEREIGRLRTLYQHQQQPQPQQQLSSRRSNSRDLNSQFATLSLKHESSTGHDSVSGALRI